MPDKQNQQDQNQQDPWAVVSTAPAPSEDTSAAPAATPASVPASANDPWAVVSQTPAPPPVPAGTPTMSAATPSVWERVKHAITKGIPAFNSDFEVASHTDTGQLSGGETPRMQLITPEAAMTASEKREHPILTGVAETAGGLTSPESTLMIAGTAGLGEISAAGKLLVPRLVSAGFSALALKGAYQQVPEFRKALDKGDEAEAERILTHIVLDTGMGVLAARHAATGGPAISDTAENAVTAGKRIASSVARGAEKVKEAPGKVVEIAKNTAEAITPEQLSKRPETPAPQHGAPVKVESPLDGPTVGKQLGGKDLSQEALDTLQKHVGDKIPVGSTAKNRLTAAVEPTVNAINETASKMNKVVNDAPDFTTSVMQDNVFGEGKFTDEIEAVKKNLPPSVREALSPDVDAVMEDADKALNSTDPSEVLEYRRKLGNQIDWSEISKNPTTAGEVQNAARAKLYRALGEKIHSEIPETVEFDKQLSPNLELRSHIRSKLGDRVVDDPHAATSEAQSEFKKGKTAIENAAHNENVAKNWQRVKYGLITLGVGSGVIHEIDKLLGL